MSYVMVPTIWDGSQVKPGMLHYTERSIMVKPSWNCFTFQVFVVRHRAGNIFHIFLHFSLFRAFYLLGFLFWAYINVLLHQLPYINLDDIKFWLISKLRALSLILPLIDLSSFWQPLWSQKHWQNIHQLLLLKSNYLVYNIHWVRLLFVLYNFIFGFNFKVCEHGFASYIYPFV